MSSEKKKEEEIQHVHSNQVHSSSLSDAGGGGGLTLLYPCPKEWTKLVCMILHCIRNQAKELVSLLYREKLVSHLDACISLYRNSVHTLFHCNGDGGVSMVEWLERELEGWTWFVTDSDEARNCVMTGKFTLIRCLLERNVFTASEPYSYDLHDPVFLLHVLVYASRSNDIHQVTQITEHMKAQDMLSKELLVQQCSAEQLTTMLRCNDECASFLLEHSVLQFLDTSALVDQLQRALFSCILRGNQKATMFLWKQHQLTIEFVVLTLRKFENLTEHLFFLLLPNTFSWLRETLGLRWDILGLNATRIFFSLFHSSVFCNQSLIAFLQLQPKLPNTLWEYVIQYYANRPSWSKQCCGAAHFILEHKTKQLRNMTVQCLLTQTAFPCLQKQAKVVLPCVSYRGDTSDMYELDRARSAANIAFRTETGFEDVMHTIPCPCLDCPYHYPNDIKFQEEEAMSIKF